MKNKKGFTLVEVLAVIAILGILVLIALPNVVESFKTAKSRNFVSEAQAVYKTAKNTYVMDSAKGYHQVSYVLGYPEQTDSYNKTIDVGGRPGFKYLVKFNEDGEVHYFHVSDNDFDIELGNVNNTSSVVKFKEIAEYFNGATITNETPTTQPTTESTTTSSTTTTTHATSCSAGYYNLNNVCTICPANYYCTGGTSAPKACLNGTTSPAGSKKLADCVASGNSNVEYTEIGNGCLKTKPDGFANGYNYQTSGGKTLVSIYKSASSAITYHVTSINENNGRYTIKVTSSTAGGAQVMNYCTFGIRINKTIDDKSDLIDIYVNNSTRRLMRVSYSGNSLY